MFALNPAIVNNGPIEEPKSTERKEKSKLQKFSPRTSVERVNKEKDKEKFKTIATRNFNDQVIINSAKFTEEVGSTSIVPPYVNKHRTKTQYRQKNKGEWPQQNNSVMSRRIDRKKFQMSVEQSKFL